ncbi:putative holin-like toxin [Thermoanaerobacterium sp. CMT5567-10]|nr:putative holin-like toxin [Thermoanaerobacterium sp. CMT5567-10]WKV09428.1 putative holin-like toxin [Thermoanaerobacterium sp. CMT5567-10]
MMNMYETLSLMIMFEMFVIAIISFNRKNNRPAPNSAVINL